MYRVYGCDYCRYAFLGTFKEVAEHEEECLMNPKLESCFTCRYWEHTQLFSPTRICVINHESFPHQYLEFNEPYPRHCSGYVAKKKSRGELV